MSKIISQERLSKDARRVLENPLMLPEISSEESYRRFHDDHDGTYEGQLALGITRDGDMWIGIDQPPGAFLRFRNYFGGGQSLRVHNALKILALAIKLDNQDKPQR